MEDYTYLYLKTNQPTNNAPPFRSSHWRLCWCGLLISLPQPSELASRHCFSKQPWPGEVSKLRGWKIDRNTMPLIQTLHSHQPMSQVVPFTGKVVKSDIYFWLPLLKFLLPLLCLYFYTFYFYFQNSYCGVCNAKINPHCSMRRNRTGMLFHVEKSCFERWTLIWPESCRS